MRLFLISDKTDPVFGMRLAGVEGICIRSAEEAEREVEKALSAGDIGILLITAGVRRLCPELIADLKCRNRPLLAEIPDSENDTGSGSSITEYIQEAIGVKL